MTLVKTAVPFIIKNMITTTIEQSKKLIDAGVNAEDTADFYYDSVGILQWRGDPILFMIASFQTPAWSFSALWNLCKEFHLVFDTGDDSAGKVMETMVKRLIAHKETK